MTKAPTLPTDMSPDGPDAALVEAVLFNLGLVNGLGTLAEQLDSLASTHMALLRTDRRYAEAYIAMKDALADVWWPQRGTNRDA